MTREPIAGAANRGPRAATVGGGRSRWRLREGPVSDDLRASDYPPLVQRLLANRGIATTAEVHSFLDGAPDDVSDPLALPNMAAAVQRLRAALRDRELVAVFGDFDVDGVTAAALLTESLLELGGAAVAYLPDRFREGYGLNAGAVEELARQGASLLVTADCGTSSPDEVRLARERGMDVIVLDHHTVPEDLPETAALVNPHLAPDAGPFLHLAAVGLAYEVVRALYESLGRAFEPESFLDLVALGTVADMAPLDGENRALVRRGLRSLAATRRPGLSALMAVARVEPAAVDSGAISFALGPRLNAAGRIRHPRLAYDLLLSRDEEEALGLARLLDQLNRERQRQTEAAMALARDLLAAEGIGAAPREAPPLLMVGHASFAAGIVGLIAARLAQELYRPAVVYELGETTSRASARSVPEFDVAAALRSCGHLFERYGGHRQAAGFTAATERLPEIRQSLQSRAGAALAGLDLAPALDVDVALPLRDLTGGDIRWLARLGPHGVGNPRPTFLSRGVTLAESRPVGAADAGHSRLKLRDGPVAWPAILFGFKSALPQPGERVDVVFALAADRRGGDRLELEVLDLCPAVDAAGGG